MEPTIVPPFDWINLGAVGVCLGLLVFIVTTVLPKMFNKYTDELRTEREAFQATLKDQRVDFQDALNKQHQMTMEMADKGNKTIDNLAAQVNRHSESIDRFSAVIDKMNGSRSDS